MADIHSIPYKAKPRAKKQSAQWVCRRCQNDIGVATSTVLVLKVAPRVSPEGRIVGGTKETVCAYCWQRGVRTLAP